MTTKPCVTPGCGQQKRQGHPRWCQECWYLRQPPDVQLHHAQLRLAAVPEPLRRARVPERDWPPGRRWCAGCQSFFRPRDAPKGSSRCRGCASAAQRDSYVQTTYGITKAEEDAIWEAQGRRCFICGREVRSKRPAVDHDHLTLAVRGMLCPDIERGCNRAILGSIEAATRSPEAALAMARRIVEYLEHPPAWPVLTQLRGEPYGTSST